MGSFELEDYEPIFVTGWGAVTPKGPANYPFLQGVWVEVFNQDYCKYLYSTSLVTDNMFCAGMA